MIVQRVLPLDQLEEEPDQTEAFAGLIFKKNGQMATERLVNGKVAVDFFADSGNRSANLKTVLERYIGPDFDVPMIMAIFEESSRSSI